MSAERPTAAELTEAAAAEALALAGETSGVVRKRLQVLAYTLALAAREVQGSPPTPPASGEDAELSAALRAGTHDADLAGVARALRPSAKARLAVVNPGYAKT